MKLTGLGKFVVFILVVGLAIGGFRWWTRSGGFPPDANSPRQSTNGNNGSSTKKERTDNDDTASDGVTGDSTPGDKTGSDAGTGDSNGQTDAQGSATQLQLITSPTTRGWLQDEIALFNEKYAGQYKVTTRFIETREAMHAILEGSAKPALWSPSSTIWADRLAQVWQQQKGATLFATDDAAAYRVYLKSPIVWLTTRDKAAFLRPILSGPDSWNQLRRLSTGARQAPYGSFKWAHADPLNANSGFLTMAIILNYYADTTGQSGDLERLAKSKDFIGFLGDVERSAARDDAISGSNKLLQAFLDQPSRYDCITTYESSALKAAAEDDNLVVIYPNPTLVSENAVASLSAPWVSEAQQQGARAFLDFLGSSESLANGVKENLRPVRSGENSLSRTIAGRAGQGFRQTYENSELPPFTAVNQATFDWSSYVAKK